MITPELVDKLQSDYCFICQDHIANPECVSIELVTTTRIVAQFLNFLLGKSVSVCDSCFEEKVYCEKLFEKFNPQSDFWNNTTLQRSCSCCQLLFNEDYYELYIPQHGNVSYQFHQECWKAMAGDDWMFAE